MTIEALREVVLNGDISLETREDAFDTAIQQAVPYRKLLDRADLGNRGRANRIAAIRYYRDLTGLGLWESKVIVEAAMALQAIPNSQY